jgi:serine/threonine-protein kinase
VTSVSTADAATIHLDLIDMSVLNRHIVCERPKPGIPMQPDPRPRVVIPPDSTAAAARRWWVRSDRPIPADLARQAARRLRVLSLLSAGLWIVATIAYHLVDRVVGQHDVSWLSWRPSDNITVAAVGVSIALFVYLGRGMRDAQRVLDLGLVYMVVMALGVGLIWHWDPPDRAPEIAPIISWIGAIVLIFAAMVPSPPVRMLVAGLVAASMNPIGMLVARARGMWEFGHAHGALVMHYPDYMLAGVSAVIAHVVYQLGQQVVKAREMGSYELGERIGGGGMGEVYRAKHRMLARPAAIKLIRPEMLSGRGEGHEMAIHRFRREAEAAATLRSPHTVELYDFGPTADGTLYFAMELLDGLDLETLIRRDGPLPAGRVIHILRQVCASLAEAHARGLVHRDIKPANIHLGRLGLEYDFVKVLDFGLVRSIASDGGADTLATAAGVVHGTPAYMAPEMAMGQAVDGRADIYSLGCVAYYLASGRLVFEGASGMQMLMRRLSEEPPPLASRTELPIPAALERIVHACLEKDAADRPASAQALSEALAAVPAEPWTEEQARAWWTTRHVAGTEATPGEATRTALIQPLK